MSITVSPSAANFDQFNRTPVQVTLTNGVGPYSASSGNTNVATVAQGTSPNLYPNSDTLSDSTLSGLSLASGGPGGAADAEYTGTGSPIGSNAILDRVVPVVMGQTYTPSFFIDPSQVTNNNGSAPNVLTEFAGSTQNADGSYTLPNGIGSATKYALSTGVPFTVDVDFRKPSGSGPSNPVDSQIIIGNSQNGYMAHWGGLGPIKIFAVVGGVNTQIAISSPGLTPDTQWHSMTLMVIPGSPNTIMVDLDGHVVTATDSSVNLTSGTWPITFYDGSSFGGIKNYTINGQIQIGINTADNLTQILQQYVALNTTTAGRYATSAWTCPTNLAPHSDALSAFSGSGFTLGTGGPGGATDAEITGTGVQTAYSYDSETISVTAGTTYNFSAWCDPSQITAGFAALGIWKADGTSAYVQPSLPNGGAAGRYNTGAWTCPSGVTQVLVRIAVQATITNGQKFKFSQPMLEPASTASGYYISSQNPQVHVYAQLLSSAIVTSGQKFKISQPMLTLSTYSPNTYISPTAVWNITPKNGGRSVVTFTDSTSPTNLTATFNATVYPLPKPRFPDALKVGSVNRKAIAYLGLDDISNGTYTRSILPMGTFLLSDSTGKTQVGEVSQSARGYDITREFDFDVFGALPPPLFGIQNDIRYDSNYALKNPSNDLKTYVCDGKRFMAAKTDNPFLASAFQSVFNGSSPPANGVNVYVGTPGSPATTPVSSSTYTWNAQTGTVTFSSAQASNAIVSIDGVPQAMAPETMLWHLFNDYGGYDPSFFKFSTSSILLPAYVGGQGKTVWQIARDIASATAPRSVVWRLRMDEYGYINFYEDKYADQPTETLVDERDFLTLSYTYTDNQLANVVRAQVEANNNQSIVSISYDIDSISDNGERKTDDISTQSFLSMRGLPPLQVKSLLDTFTAVELHDKSQPMLEITATMLANPARQVGDKVTVIERQNGLSGPYIIKGITDTVDTGTWLQECRLRQAKLFANQNMGLPSAVTNAPAPGTSGDISQNKNAGVSGRTGIFKSVSVGGTNVISNGGIIYDSSGNPVIPVISGATWNFSFTLDSSQQYDTTVYRFLYFECPNTLSSSDIMAICAPYWVSANGSVITAATIAAGYTENSSHTTGTSLGSGENAYLYSNLVYPAYANSLPPGYQSQMTTINWLSSTGLSGQVGAGLGPAYTGSYAWLPQQKYNFGFFTLVAYNASGTTSILRIPTILSC